jgi:peptidoglycan/xylan/chitin deacetylase (PgdA/CDA1 family)
MKHRNNQRQSRPHKRKKKRLSRQLPLMGALAGFVLMLLFMSALVRYSWAEEPQPTEVVLSPEPTVPPSPSPVPTATPIPKIAYLTFDDGPDIFGYSLEVSAKLKSEGALATFFFNGADPTLPNNPYSDDALQRIYFTDSNDAYIVNLVRDDGHAIGIHGWRHDNYWYDQFDGGQNQVLKVELALKQIMTVETLPHQLLRAPGGSWTISAQSGQYVNVPGYENWYHYGWTIDPKDIVGTSAEQVIEHTLAITAAKNWPDEAIFVFHSSNQGTRDAFVEQNLLQRLKDEGGYTHFHSLPRPNDAAGEVIEGY